MNVLELKRFIRETVYRLINLLVKKDEQSILLIPHFNCIADKYDIINYKSDNVLCLVNKLIIDKRLDSYRINLIYYHKDRLCDYTEYRDHIGCNNLNFIYFEDTFEYQRAFFESKIIFTDEYISRYTYKTREQIIVCLNYFSAPFKGGLYNTVLSNEKESINLYKSINRSFDYIISISDIASKMISVSCLLNYTKFLPLGFPRNDIFFMDNSNIKERILKNIKIEAKKIIVYVPTHRDYLNPSRKTFDVSCKLNSVMGSDDKESNDILDKVLKDNNAILIAKIHPEQAKQFESLDHSERIYTYSEILRYTNISLNEMMSIADIMITDYTSAVYDFLYTDRPIIYYFYDFAKYDNSRGFTVNPIIPFCTGDIAYDLKSLANSLDKALNGIDEWKEKRLFFKDMFIKYKDGKSNERIIDHFFFNKYAN